MDVVLRVTQARSAPSALRPLRARARLMTGAATCAAAAISAAAGLSVLFIQPQNSHSCGGEEEQTDQNKYGRHSIMPLL
jgi:hypothetical protein